MIFYLRIPHIQLYKLIVPLPVFIPKTVIAVGIPTKVNMKPVFIGAVPLLFLYIPKRPEATPHMVEYTIQHHTHTSLMDCLAHSSKIFIGTKAWVYGKIISGIIAVAVAVKNGVE